MLKRSVAPMAMVGMLVVLACGERPPEDPADRDLSLAPAEAGAAIDDQPATPPDAPAAQTPAPAARQPAPRPAPPPQPRVVSLVVPTGTDITLFARDTLTSRHNRKGEEVIATNAEPIMDAQGRVVIPPAAVFIGTISDIAPADNPGGEGRMILTFSRVQFGGDVFSVQARTDSMGSYMKGRGVTTGDVVTVGAGAVVGGVAGRIIGGNRTGTIVGAAAGAAAGAGIAHATRDIDIILPAGAPISIVLTAPFEIQIEIT